MDKQSIVDLFNDLFASANYLFDSTFSASIHVVPASPQSSNSGEGRPIWEAGFSFEFISVEEVLKVLKAQDHTKPSGPDGLDTYLLKLSAELIADPLAHIFNLSFN